MVKAGIYPKEKNHEEKVAEDISVKEVKENGIEDSKKESVVIKGFDLKAVANDLGVINTDARLLPVDNPIGIKCYTKVISLGEALGFNGETTQDTTIIWWIATMMAQKLCEGGVDLTNENTKEKSKKYIELLLPFACVAFAAYAANGENMKGKDISEMVKETFEIDMTELIIRKILKDWLV